MRQEKGPGVGLSLEEVVLSWLEAGEAGEVAEGLRGGWARGLRPLGPAV